MYNSGECDPHRFKTFHFILCKNILSVAFATLDGCYTVGTCSLDTPLTSNAFDPKNNILTRRSHGWEISVCCLTTAWPWTRLLGSLGMILPSKEEEEKKRRLNLQKVSAVTEFLACIHIKLWEQTVLNFIHIKSLSVTMLFTKLDGNDCHPVSTVDIRKCYILGCTLHASFDYFSHLT